MSEQTKDWENIRIHAFRIARNRHVPFDLCEDAAQYACERLWIDSDWTHADATVIWNKITDWIRTEIGRTDRGHLRGGVLWNNESSLDYDGPEGESWNPPEVATTDTYPGLREIPEIPYRVGCINQSTDRKNFAIACVAFGISQRDVADALGVTESAVTLMLRSCQKHVNREDLLP